MTTLNKDAVDKAAQALKPVLLDPKRAEEAAVQALTAYFQYEEENEGIMAKVL